MLESKREFVVLRTNLSSTSTKRSPFHLLSSIFSKKKPNILDNELQEKPDESTELQSKNTYHYQEIETEGDSLPTFHSTIPGTLEEHSKGIEEASPTATEVLKRKDLNLDLETLHLSRQDNPFLKQLERFSLPEETILSCLDFHQLTEKALFCCEWQSNLEKEVDLHQHLVRSPPPYFPQNISHFIYSQANSPKRRTTNEEKSEPFPVKCIENLNPVKTRKEIGVLDPSIRDVIEYQKSQLIAGYTSSGTSSRWIHDSGTISFSLEHSKAKTTTSLPGLSTCYFEGKPTCRRATLGPIRIGRTLSDSMCHDNKFRKKAARQ